MKIQLVLVEGYIILFKYLCIHYLRTLSVYEAVQGRVMELLVNNKF
jgi:hypothetical protein